MAFGTKNTNLFWSTSTAVSTSSSALVGELMSLDGPTGSVPVIDITNLASTAREKLVGIQDEGQVSGEVLWDPTNVAQIALRADRQAGTKKKFSIKYADISSSVQQGDAFCINFAVSSPLDDAVKASFTLEITGAVTHTTA